MGRDDARPIAGLPGGTAPARAFHDFMRAAVAGRPVETVETAVPVPDWDLGAEEDIYAADGNQVGFEPLVDENGNPLPNQPIDPMAQPGTMLPPGQQQPGGQVNQDYLDRVFPPSGQRPGQPQPQVVRPPPNAPPQGPRSVPATDPLEPRPDPSEQ